MGRRGLELALQSVYVGWVLLVMSEAQTLYSDCPDSCGGIKIPYPFGIGETKGKKCYLPDFEVLCEGNNIRLANLKEDRENFTVSEIRVPEHQVQLKSNNKVAIDCLYYYGDGTNFTTKVEINLNGPFKLSARWNRFRAFGCDTIADINKVPSFEGRCDTQWMLDSSGKRYGGVGQCQIGLPDLSPYFFYNVTNQLRYTKASCTMRCSFAMIVEASLDVDMDILCSYSNQNNCITHQPSPATPNNGILLPLVAEWEILDGKCIKNNTSPTCGRNTFCNYTGTADSGYRCYCKDGGRGNPYLNGNSGCDGDSGFPALPLALAGGIFLAGSLGAASYSYGSWAQKEAMRKAATELLKNLHENADFSPPDPDAVDIDVDGGDGDVGGGDGEGGNPKDFNKDDLRKAIKAARTGRRVATLAAQRRRRGLQQGIVKAELPEDGMVEITKYNVENKVQLEPFIKAVRTVCRKLVNPNVVTLLGISTRESSLIYRHFSDQTLFDRLHGSSSSEGDVEGQGGGLPLSWEQRLNIARGTARALVRGHAQGVCHRNVKSSNILVKEGTCDPGVIDFGVARLWKKRTLLKESQGYVDPEYVNDGKPMTSKSDVYSFGVVLVELLTGQNPSSSSSSSSRQEEGGVGNISSLAAEFVKAVDEGRLEEVVDGHIWGEVGRREEIKGVAGIARRCLNQVREKRPTMKQVWSDLDPKADESQRSKRPGQRQRGQQGGGNGTGSGSRQDDGGDQTSFQQGVETGIAEGQGDDGIFASI